MTQCDNENLFEAVVVGDSEDDCVERMVDLLGELGISSIRCEDVYAAVGRLGQLGGEDVLVVGRIQELSKEQGRLFHIVRQRGFACCCLAARGTNADWGKAGLWRLDGDRAFLIDAAERITEVIDRLGRFARNDGSQKGPLDNIHDEHFHASRAEMEALLGLWIDDRGQRRQR